ncbi:nuclear speckle splicing regulatory protein 1 [Gadus macrocephalus]|uniref:nuclear speckle splicing regulatory protein 1 n=1 Tax=Gadus macrocephalus TaxID=80720 RepID=UPI0028CB6431|nr:nuclear speckle splicing regulatory protein 1 [Gadus macrocephalus]
MAAPGKQYGLILSQKKSLTKNATLQRPSVFGDDSDDETTVGESLQKEAVKKRSMKQTRLEMQKALEQDSTVYDYDGVYDDIQNQRLESSKKILGGTDRKPKYINQLMKAVEERKKEQERRDERKIQKEREAEGEEFADKEAYVTAAYRQKLKEREEEQEKEKRDAAMEAALDVKKQKDLSGFYRHLLNQTVGEEAIPDSTADRPQSSVPPTEPDPPPAAPLSPSRDNGTLLNSDSEDGHESKPGFSKPGHSSGHAKRHYRQRSASPGGERARDKGKDRDRHKKSQRDGERDKDRDRRKERDGEREDRTRGRRDDKDRRKDRAGEPERDGGQHRGREDRGKEDRQERREKSPKERRREEEEEEEEKRRGKRGSPPEQQKEGKEGKERMKDPEADKAIKPEPTDKEGGGEGETQSGGAGKQGEDGGSQGEEKASKFAKRSSDHTVSSARDRYLARQMARSGSKAYIEKEED